MNGLHPDPYLVGPPTQHTTPKARTPAGCVVSLFFTLACVGLCPAQSTRETTPIPSSIRSGIAWFDQNEKTVSAHGAGMLKVGDVYYLFGEFKRDGGNEFAGFSCYASPNLVDWTFRRMALPVQPNGPLGPGRVCERPKVLRCPRSGEYVMFMHTDDLAYKDQAVGYATSPTVDGEYTFRGPLLFDGKPIKLWDMGVFQDDDGAGYLITHSGNLFLLADDYKSVTRQVVKNMTDGCEAPAIFKRNGIYYWLGSGLTSWERNDNFYFTARSLEGPWKRQGLFAPEGTLTWNSQTTFVFPVAGTETTTWMFMGDRWAHPRQNSAATYVWQPLEFDDAGRMSLPTFRPSWSIDVKTGRTSDVEIRGTRRALTADGGARFSGTWRPHTHAAGLADTRSDEKGATLTIPFTGTAIGLYSVASPDGGFGDVKITDARGNVVLSTIMETYCRYPEASMKFLSPSLPRGDYVLTLKVLGERFFYQAKTAAYGSEGDFVSVREVLIVD